MNNLSKSESLNACKMPQICFIPETCVKILTFRRSFESQNCSLQSSKWQNCLFSSWFAQHVFFRTNRYFWPHFLFNSRMSSGSKNVTRGQAQIFCFMRVVIQPTESFARVTSPSSPSSSVSSVSSAWRSNVLKKFFWVHNNQPYGRRGQVAMAPWLKLKWNLLICPPA